MGIRSHENSVAAWAFLIGIIIAVVIGISTKLLPIDPLVKYNSAIFAILVLLGLVVGFTANVSGKDSQIFLLSGAVLVIVSNFAKDSVTGSLIGIFVGDAVKTIFSALITLFAPATIVVAVKSMFSVSKI